MADCGFTIKDMLQEVGVKLNIPGRATMTTNKGGTRGKAHSFCKDTCGKGDRED